MHSFHTSNPTTLSKLNPSNDKDGACKTWWLRLKLPKAFKTMEPKNLTRLGDEWLGGGVPHIEGNQTYILNFHVFSFKPVGCMNTRPKYPHPSPLHTSHQKHPTQNCRVKWHCFLPRRLHVHAWAPGQCFAKSNDLADPETSKARCLTNHHEPKGTRASLGKVPRKTTKDGSDE